MVLYLQFLLDTVKGLIVVTVIPMVAFISYSAIRIRKWGGAVSGKSKRWLGPPNPNPPEGEKRADDEWLWTNRYIQTKPCNEKWFKLYGFHGIEKVGRMPKKGWYPAIFWLEIVAGFALYPFFGHTACIILIGLMANGGENIIFEFVTLNPSFLQWHLTMAIIISSSELFISLSRYILNQVEVSVTAMLLKIRDHLCANLGNDRGVEAARFLALLIDMCFDKKGFRSVRMLAYKKRWMSGKDFTSHLVDLYEKSRDVSGLQQSSYLTEEGLALYQDICKTL
ncbi:hypothetical protein [Flavonifractor sp. An306]|uniref:hypothetical protein n=1 Tax=Flavonifractor sp. An306 TaxID=1965629 RepID=UPI00174E44B9|nr:hypothetical protein [Flavonifractor sp. An306]